MSQKYDAQRCNTGATVRRAAMVPHRGRSTTLRGKTLRGAIRGTRRERQRRSGKRRENTWLYSRSPWHNQRHPLAKPRHGEAGRTISLLKCSKNIRDAWMKQFNLSSSK